MLKTEWIRAAVEGETVDGRIISGLELDQMAGSYNPEVYQAKIWLEHMRGIFPDGLLKPLGTVAAVKVDMINGGELDGKKALYVILEPTPELVSMVRSGQKVHLSLEIHPAFPTTNGAYLMGVGVTDSPASVGTGIMKFSKEKRPNSLFTSPIACELGNCAGDKDDNMKVIRTLLEKLAANNPEPWKGVPTPPVEPHKFASETEFSKLKRDFEKLKSEWEWYMSQDVTPERHELGSSAAYKKTSQAGY